MREEAADAGRYKANLPDDTKSYPKSKFSRSKV